LIVQGGASRSGRVGGPHHLDEAVDRHRAGIGEGQSGEQNPLQRGDPDLVALGIDETASIEDHEKPLDYHVLVGQV
jgi:hypothetical protein